MKEGLRLFEMETHTPEWYDFRKNGIGGSEIGTILGLNKYDTAARLYHEKVGTYVPEDMDNRLMFWGREHEEKIAEIWQYWDGTDDGYVANKKNGKIIRTCKVVDGYVVNPKYPWLFASVDRLMDKDTAINMITGEPLNDEGILEIKTLSYWAANVWEDGIPPYYLAQITQYMIIFELDYAEIAILKDGNQFDVEYLERNEDLVDRLLIKSKDFWYNQVLPARKAKEERDKADIEGNYQVAEKNDSIIQHLEPSPDHTKAYQEFMAERYMKVREKMKGSMKLYTLCQKDEVLKKIIKVLSDKRDLIKNILSLEMVKNNTDYIDFGSMGSVNWPEKNGKRQSPIVRLKDKPDQEAIEKEADIVDLNIY